MVKCVIKDAYNLSTRSKEDMVVTHIYKSERTSKAGNVSYSYRAAGTGKTSGKPMSRIVSKDDADNLLAKLGKKRFDVKK